MFIEIENKRGVYGNFGNKSRRLNLQSIDIIEFDEQKMFVEDGKPMPHRQPRSYGSKDTGDMLTVKMILLKKWQANTNFKKEDYILYFIPEGFDDYNRIKNFLDEQTQTF